MLRRGTGAQASRGMLRDCRGKDFGLESSGIPLADVLPREVEGQRDGRSIAILSLFFLLTRRRCVMLHA